MIIFLHTTKTFHFPIWFEFVLEGFFKSFQRTNSIICSKLSKYFSKKRHWLKFSNFWLRNFSHNQPLLHVSVLAQPTISATFSQLDQRIIKGLKAFLHTHKFELSWVSKTKKLKWLVHVVFPTSLNITKRNLQIVHFLTVQGQWMKRTYRDENYNITTCWKIVSAHAFFLEVTTYFKGLKYIISTEIENEKTVKLVSFIYNVSYRNDLASNGRHL